MDHFPYPVTKIGLSTPVVSQNNVDQKILENRQQLNEVCCLHSLRKEATVGDVGDALQYWYDVRTQ